MCYEANWSRGKKKQTANTTKGEAMTRPALAAASALLLVACGQYDPLPSDPQIGTATSSLRRDVRPHGKHFNQEANAQRGQGDDGRIRTVGLAGTTGYGIVYHGGPVMHGTTNAYFIWYGNWSGNTATTILTDMISNFGGSPYYNINTTYGDSSGQSVMNSVHYAGAANDNYSRGTALSDADIQTIVASHIGGGQFPLDTNGIYFVLTSADVNETSGFCTQYCGWHTNGTINGADIKYSFIGNADRCLSGCAAQTTGPNGNAGADGMASIIAHEFEESTSDPDLNAWYDSTGAENGDKCAWTFGTEYTTGNGAKANMRLGSRDFLIQQNWLNTAPSGSCVLSYGSCTPNCTGKTCGSDGCGGSCGSCTAPQTCGGGGVAGQCGCTASCSGKTCGSNGCGGSCGTCSTGQVCTSGGACCTPTTCAAHGANCGSLADGCGGTLNCGSCTAPATCGGGGVANVCGVGSSVIVNGDFETGSLSGWTTSGTTSISTTAHGGRYAAQCGGASPTNGNSSITQTFKVPSTGGTLSFWYRVTCPDTVQYDWATATLKDNSTNKTVTLLPKTCTNNGTWVQLSKSVATNAGHSVTLTLTSRDDNYPGDPTYTLFDDVKLQ
jgi:phosphate-induced protein 1